MVDRPITAEFGSAASIRKESMARSGTSSLFKIYVLPVLIFVISAGALVLLWHDHMQDEHRRLAMETEITAEQIRLRLESWVDDRTAIVLHLADVMEHGELASESKFIAESLHFLELYPGFLALNYVNADGVIDIVVPHAPNLAASKQSLYEHPEPDVRESFIRSGETNRMTRTYVSNLLQGYRGIATYAPVKSPDADRPSGYINGVFRIDRLIESCLSEASLSSHFRFTISEFDNTIAYASSKTFDLAEAPYCASTVIRIVDRPWTLHLAPHSTRYPVASPLESNLVLVGILMSLALAMLIHSTMKRHVELAISKANYKLLVENQKDLIVKLDSDFRVLFVSPSYCRTFDVSADAVLGRPITETIPADEREATLSALRTAVVTRDTTNHEQWIPAAQGSRWLAWNDNAVFDENGEHKAVMMVGRDITARRSLEEQLIQSQKMQAVGQLAGGIAHDFNNILQSISGSIELAMLDTETDSQPYRDMDQARRSAARAASLTRQLLAFSRRQVLMPQNIDLNLVVRDMQELLLRSVGRNVVIDYEFAQDSAVIHADSTQIQQILLNLCVNSRDAMDESGSVHIKVDHGVLDRTFCHSRPWAKPGNYVILEVSDDGCGMDTQTMDNLFEPFFTTKQSTGGTGLGLATVYGIVKQHHGLLDVESEPGSGTTFRIYFERAGEAAEVIKPELSPDARGGRETILLAEDDPAVRNFTVRALESAGYRVLATVDGDDALKTFARHRDDIDMLLLDVVMPKTGGREVHDTVRSSNTDIPVLFCSGFDSEATHSRFILDEGLTLLPKPFDREQLLRQIRSLLDSAHAQN